MTTPTTDPQSTPAAVAERMQRAALRARDILNACGRELDRAKAARPEFDEDGAHQAFLDDPNTYDKLCKLAAIADAMGTTLPEIARKALQSEEERLMFRPTLESNVRHDRAERNTDALLARLHQERTVRPKTANPGVKPGGELSRNPNAHHWHRPVLNSTRRHLANLGREIEALPDGWVSVASTTGYAPDLIRRWTQDPPPDLSADTVHALALAVFVAQGNPSPHDEPAALTAFREFLASLL